MLLLLKEVLRFVFQSVMTWRQQNFPNSAPLTENYHYQSRGVPKESTLHTLTFKLHHLSQATDQMGAEYNQLVRDKFCQSIAL